MESHARGLGLAAVATFSTKAVNQDACGVAINGKWPLSAVVVADGLGSHFGADIASAVVADSMVAGLTALDRGRPVNLPDAFAAAHTRLANDVAARRDTLPASLDWNQAFGTTAICAVDAGDTLTLGYSGNGGIFHLRGNFNTFPPSQVLPWSSINYLNPHSVPLDGKNAMYKLLSPKSGAVEVAPSVVTIAKDDSWFGDIVLCCTDGVYSYDQTAIGRDGRDNIWISGTAAMSRFYDCLKVFFSNEPSNGALEAALELYLAGLNDAGLVDDDCTVGVLITERALAFQAQLREKRAAGVTS